MHTLQRMVLVVGLILTMGLLLISCTDEIEMVRSILTVGREVPWMQ